MVALVRTNPRPTSEARLPSLTLRASWSLPTDQKNGDSHRAPWIG
jgi:hypothetical protein